MFEWIPRHKTWRFSPWDARDASWMSQVDVTERDVAIFANARLRTFVCDWKKNPCFNVYDIEPGLRTKLSKSKIL